MNDDRADDDKAGEFRDLDDPIVAEIRRAIRSCYTSIASAPPENHPLYWNRLGEDMMGVARDIVALRRRSGENKYGVSDAQVLFHHLKNVLVLAHPDNVVNIMVTPPEHDRIGDDRDGWGAHVIVDGKQVTCGLGKTLEGALIETVRLLHFDALYVAYGGDTATAFMQSHSRMRETLSMLGLDGYYEAAEGL